VRAAVSLLEDYREFAEECLRWAAQAPTDEQRQSLLELVKTWELAALQLEQAKEGRSVANGQPKAAHP
jgi:hypothetical protein